MKNIKNIKRKTKRTIKIQTTEDKSESLDSLEDSHYNDDSNMNADANDDPECIFCTENFSDDRHGETWIQCSICIRWAHEDCNWY